MSFRRDVLESKEAQRELLKRVQRRAGNLAQTARDIGIGREYLWTVLRLAGLWPEVQQIRARAEMLYRVKTHRRGFATRSYAP